MLTIQEIINEADILVPNEIGAGDKVIQLNLINGDFFNVVKIPKIHRFAVTSSEFSLPPEVREKNVDYVQVGALKYRGLDAGNVSPLQNVYFYDDVTKRMTISPGPYISGLQGIVRYYRIATQTFLPSDLNAVPDAPEEYQFSYIPALASWMAGAQDDAANAANYEAQYKAAWNVAAQNFLGGAT